MRFFTKFNLMLLAVMLGVSVEANAAVEKATDLFGKYKFTATVTYTEKGEQYKDRLLAECDVTIGEDPDGIYDAAITNLAGSPKLQKINSIDLDKCTIGVNNPNTSSYFFWGDPLSMADAEGNFPYSIWSQNEAERKDAWQVEYTFDPETGTITLPDFTAVTTDWANNTAEVMAYFKECKLTLTEKEEIIISDMSGDYNATLGGMAFPDSDFKYEAFEMTLTATADDFSKYTAEIVFDENLKTTVENVEFDGNTMTFNIKDNYLNAEKTYALIEGTNILEGKITFKKASEESLVLDSYFCVGQLTKDDENNDIMGMVQAYTTSIAKKVSNVTLEGVYRVTATPDIVEEDYEYPSEFDVEIYISSYSGNYLVKNFLTGGNNVYNMNNGGLVCTVEGNTLKIPTGVNASIRRVFMAEDFSNWIYDTLHDAAGGDNPIELTVNADGTATLSDFSVRRTKTYYDADNNMQKESTIACLYTVTNVVSGIEVVENTTNANAPEGIYTVSGVRVADKASKLNTLPTGMYIVKDGNRTVKVVR